MNILYLCTGNSCRSQIAEGWTRHLGGNRIAVRSAGIEAHGLNPDAVATMAAVDVDISGQKSAILNSSDLDWADWVVTVCGDADAQCPLLPLGTRKIHWPVADPARVSGTAAQIETVFASTRDALRGHVQALLDALAQTT